MATMADALIADRFGSTTSATIESATSMFGAPSTVDFNVLSYHIDDLGIRRDDVDEHGFLEQRLVWPVWKM